MNIGQYSIRRKLTWMNLLISGLTLLIASSAFVAYELATLRLSMVRNLSVQAQIAGANCASAIMFGDPDSARDTLAALSAAPNIISVAVYTPASSGAPFADWVRPDFATIDAPQLSLTGPAEAYSFANNSLELVRPIVFQGNRIGTVYIRSDLQEIFSRLERYAGIVAIILLISLPAALLFSTIFQSATTRPIVQLAEVARMVSREKKYDVRAPAVTSQDEIALLVEAFNEMLDQILERDAALHNTHERLNLALHSSGIGTWSWSIPENTIEWDDFMYPLFALLTGTPIRHETFLSMVHPKDRQRVSKIGASQETRFEIEFRVVWPDGSIHTLSSRGKVIRNEINEPIRLTGVCWDVSERKRVEEDRQKFVSLVEQTDDFVGMIGFDGSIIFLNRAGCGLVGIEPAKAVGTPFADLHPEDAWAKLNEEVLPSIVRGDGNWVGRPVYVISPRANRSTS